MKSFFKNIGPATLVAAAFIGPGTVTLCNIAGASFGYALLWAMALSIVATLVLQEMSARLGVITQSGLAEQIRKQLTNPMARGPAIALVLSAIVIGNAAYEAGNISGGALGLETWWGSSHTIRVFFVGGMAFLLLFLGNYKWLERILIALVILMSISFLLVALLTRPDLTEFFGGFVPQLPKGSLFVVIGLIGTTVIPYNLFLHSSLVKEKWHSKDDVPLARKDMLVSVISGGVVSLAIILCAAPLQGQVVNNATDLANGLTPLYGEFSQYVLSAGLFAAGITSAITAPLAAALVAKGCFGWKGGLKSTGFRIVWMLILGMGVLFSSLGIKSIEVIKFAQVANGLLLPLVAGFLVWIMNRSALLGKYRNTIWQNALSVFIVLITLLLGIWSILKVFNLI